jgi:hypothetical protein
MKTTIEVKGYLLVIDETEESVTVTATKDEDIVEEFSLDLTEGEEGAEDIEVPGDEIKSFGEFEEEEDFEKEFDGEKDDDDDDDDDDDEGEVEDLEDAGEVKLESFQSFINKRK